MLQENNEMENLPHFRYVSTYSGYHYDRNQPDSDLIFKKKFNFPEGMVDSLIDRFVPYEACPIDLEDLTKRLQAEEWINLGYDIQIRKYCGKKADVDDRYPELQRLLNQFPMTNLKGYFTQQEKGDALPYHHDTYKRDNELEDVKKTGWRFLVFLTRWEPGQFFCYGNSMFSHWEPGYIFGWPLTKYPHASGNFSHHTRYSLRVDGFLTDSTLDWANSDEIIDFK